MGIILYNKQHFKKKPSFIVCQLNFKRITFPFSGQNFRLICFRGTFQPQWCLFSIFLCGFCARPCVGSGLLPVLHFPRNEFVSLSSSFLGLKENNSCCGERNKREKNYQDQGWNLALWTTLNVKFYLSWSLEKYKIIWDKLVPV